MQMLPAVTTTMSYPCYTFNLPLFYCETKKIIGSEITSVSKSPLPKKKNQPKKLKNHKACGPLKAVIWFMALNVK